MNDYIIIGNAQHNQHDSPHALSPILLLLALCFLLRAFSSLLKSFEIPFCTLVDLTDYITDFRMIFTTTVPNLRPLHRFPVFDVPSSALVTNSKLVAFLDKVFQLVSKTI
jgi:hypothetical protein